MWAPQNRTAPMPHVPGQLRVRTFLPTGSPIQGRLVPPASCTWARSGVNARGSWSQSSLACQPSPSSSKWQRFPSCRVKKNKPMRRSDVYTRAKCLSVFFFQLVPFRAQPGDRQMNAECLFCLDTMLFYYLYLPSFLFFSLFTFNKYPLVSFAFFEEKKVITE